MENSINQVGGKKNAASNKGNAQTGIMNASESDNELYKIMNGLEKRISKLEECIADMYSHVQYYKHDNLTMTKGLKDIKEQLYNSDEYWPVYTGLNNRVLELSGIIEDKERIILLQQKQLDTNEKTISRLEGKNKAL